MKKIPKNNFSSTVDVMKTPLVNAALGLQLVQIAWVVKDLTLAEEFFRNGLGVGRFGASVVIRERDFEATYYGKPSNAESLVSMAYSGGTFIELIQPLSGSSTSAATIRPGFLPQYEP